MTNRNYNVPTISTEWADSRHTDMAVATAIHAIADSKRSADAIWEASTPAEWDHVCMAVAEYVANGEFAFDAEGYCWGNEKVEIEEPAE